MLFMIDDYIARREMTGFPFFFVLSTYLAAKALISPAQNVLIFHVASSPP
jgi:hypothetical protein